MVARIIDFAGQLGRPYTERSTICKRCSGISLANRTEYKLGNIYQKDQLQK